MNPILRFHALPRSYFPAVPYELRDPGAELSPEGEAKLDGVDHNLARMTFDTGTGDAPDHRSSSIATGRTTDSPPSPTSSPTGEDPDEVTEDDARAIVYQDYEVIDGVPIQVRWSF